MAGSDEPKLRELDEVLEHIGEGFQVIDRQWRYVYVNRAACEHGRRSREELIGRTMIEVYPDIETTPMFHALEQCMANGEPQTFDNEFTFPDGSKRWFELRIYAVPEGVAVSSVDITERKQLQEQVRRAAKMELMDRMASGLAHDFNNMLTVIMSFASSALQSSAQGDSRTAGEDLEQVLQATRRAADLIQKLFDAASTSWSEAAPVDIGPVLARINQRLRSVLQPHIALREHIAQPLWTVPLSEDSLERLILNLAFNARDAMVKGGILTIEACNQVVDEARTTACGQILAAGEFVAITVRDVGPGIDPTLHDRIFEPFYTSKGRRGTGLGLSTCLGITHQVGGAMELDSAPGKGARFTAYLPRRVALSGSP